MRTDYVGLNCERRDLIIQVLVLALLSVLSFAAATIWMCLDDHLQFLVYEVGLLCNGSFIAGVWITSALDLLRIHKKLTQIQ